MTTERALADLMEEFWKNGMPQFDGRYCCKEGEWHGLRLLDADKGVCREHETPELRDLLVELYRRGKAIGLPLDADSHWKFRWATGGMRWPGTAAGTITARVRLLEWAEENNMRWNNSKRVCFHRVFGLHCGDYYCPGVAQSAEEVGVSSSWADHVSMWTDAQNRRVLVSHPYADAESAREAFAELDQIDGVSVTVREDSWYYLGRTVQIEVAAEGRIEVLRERARAARKRAKDARNLRFY